MKGYDNILQLLFTQLTQARRVAGRLAVVSCNDHHRSLQHSSLHNMLLVLTAKLIYVLNCAWQARNCGLLRIYAVDRLYMITQYCCT